MMLSRCRSPMPNWDTDDQRMARREDTVGVRGYVVVDVCMCVFVRACVSQQVVKHVKASFPYNL